MHICRKLLKMKPYEEIVLSYINKYHEINLEQLQYEIGLNISLISDILRNLYEKEYYKIDNEKLYLTEKATNSITELWNDWSFSNKDLFSPKTIRFNWDFLYIPTEFDNI